MESGDRMLTLGGELADGVMLGFIHKEMLQDYVDLVRAGAARSGGNPRICYWAMMITSEQVLEQIQIELQFPVLFAVLGGFFLRYH